MRGTMRIAAATAVLVMAHALSGCAPPGGDGDAAIVDGRQPDAVTSETGEVALVERDAFLAEQALPLDGSPLAAVTGAQRDLVAQQRAHVESQGGTWSAEAESITLALALDACETAILNAHEVGPDTLRVHVASSPLISGLLPAGASAEDARATERAIVSIAVFGAGFLCPDDHARWQGAFAEVYGG